MYVCKPKLPNQTYQTKPNKPNLPNQTKLSQPGLLNQTYRTKPTKPNQNYWLKLSTPAHVVPLAMFQLTDNCEVCNDTIFGAKRLCACEWSSFKMVPFCSIEIAFIMYGIYYTIHDGCGILSRNASFSLI